MNMNSLIKTPYSSPLLISVDKPFDRTIADHARNEAIGVWGDSTSNHQIIDIFEGLWRGERERSTLYCVFHLDIYEDWARAINRLLDKHSCDALGAQGAGQ